MTRIRSRQRAGGPRAGTIVLAYVCLAACSSEPIERPALEAPRSVILISLDTLRADYLGLYDYSKFSTSPFLDSFAGQSFVFENSIVAEPWTLTSHMSLMTGLHPQNHGVGPDIDLAEGVATLASRLADAGWATAAFTDGGWMRNKWGLNRGFDTYSGRKRRGFRTVLEEARGWLDDNANERFFLFLHTYDVHGWGVRPFYRSPSPARGMFTTELPSELATEDVKEFERLFAEREEVLTDADRDFIRATYAEGVRYVDSELRDFFADLEARGILEHALVVIWSDHGEGLADHSEWGHAEVYDHTIRSPLIIRVPGLNGKGRRIQSVVAAVDIAPTLLELAQLPPIVPCDGQSFVDYFYEDPSEGEAFSIYTGRGRPEHVQLPANPWFSMRTPTHHLIHNSELDEYLFYDLRVDPLEQTDLAGTGGDVEEHMRERLAEFRLNYRGGSKAKRVGDDEILDEDTAEQLRALGYGG